MRPDTLPSPWAEFFDAVDQALSGPVELHCLGGFVVSICYGRERQTVDLDVVTIAPIAGIDEILRIAGKGSALARRHRIYIDYVTVASIPESYEARLREVFAGRFGRLRMLALNPYDLALTKLERNLDQDREDVRFLAVTIPLDPHVLP